MSDVSNVGDGNDIVDIETDILKQVGETNDEQNEGEGTSGENGAASQDAGTTQQGPSNKQGTNTGTPSQQQNKQTTGPQDLVDAQGNVIAKGGKERRFYEAAQKERTRAEQLNRQVEQLNTKIEAFEKAGSVGSQFGLSPDEVVTGAQLLAAWKKSPVDTVKYLLTQAQAMGHNIEAITGSPGAFDPGVIKTMIQDQLRPILDRHQQESVTQETTQRAQEAYDKFFGTFPDAKVHEDTLARLLKDDSTLSPEAAYYKLKSYYLERGLDWSKSLAQLQQANQQQQQQPASVTQRQPLPNGNIAPNRATNADEVADVNTSSDDIVKAAMREAGFNI